jgi:hypothetical protein
LKTEAKGVKKEALLGGDVSEYIRRASWVRLEKLRCWNLGMGLEYLNCSN